MISKEEYESACQDKKKAELVIDTYFKEKDEQFKARWKEFDEHRQPFTDDELRYSAYDRCKKCNAGLAYPIDCGGHHQWTCSNVLKDIGTDKGHDAFLFIMYSIKSEDQPSCNGNTTRPKPE